MGQITGLVPVWLEGPLQSDLVCELCIVEDAGPYYAFESSPLLSRHEGCYETDPFPAPLQ